MGRTGVTIMGRKWIPTMATKTMFRLAPKANARARCIGKEARGKNLEQRKEVFASKCGGVKGA